MNMLRFSLASLGALLLSSPALAQPAPTVPEGYEATPPASPSAGSSSSSQAPSSVGAQAYDTGAPEPATPAVDEGHDVSITISPLHLLFPIVEVTAEFKLSESVGVAGILGGGSVELTNAFGPNESVGVFELGGQLHWYPVGDFDHGMQLGLEALFVHVSAEFEGGVTGQGSGLAVGPLVGYKYVAPFGLTVNLQGGVAVAGIGAEATDGTTTESDSTVEVIPLLNINAGWSF